MIAIIQYNAGNIRSVANAVRRLGHTSVITSDPAIIRRADKIILPGVGQASAAMQFLRQRGLDQTLRQLKQPLLGICLGLQLMCRHTEEGNTSCLGLFDIRVKRFPPGKPVPHMGWNRFSYTEGALFHNIPPGSYVYYAHSYYAETGPHTIASCRYSVPFSAALQNSNYYATQFHPEKSAETGSLILNNFLNL